MSQSRGVLYLQWGAEHPALVQRSFASLRAIYPALPVHIHTLPDHATLLDKAQMFDLSPFEETLFLDADTVVLDSLDFGFELARRTGLACCICECPWARRFTGLSGDIIEYNTGVLFFTRAARPLFDAWKDCITRVDSSMQLRKPSGEVLSFQYNDQAAFAKAIVETGFNPGVLPMNWNFRSTWQHSFFGPIKIWHNMDAPPPAVYEVNRLQSGGQKLIDFFRIQSASAGDRPFPMPPNR